MVKNNLDDLIRKKKVIVGVHNVIIFLFLNAN